MKTISKTDQSNIKFVSYVTGFLLSIALTTTAYYIVVHQSFRNLNTIIASVLVLALIQFGVQLYFFLHLGKETKPRWKLFVFLAMVTIVLILVVGSIWIMDNLNTRMTPQQVNTYINNQGGGF
jgi:cytochrome o ubiquinol oxidase operon protein cyoD